MKALVTGAAGFIGSTLVDVARRGGVDVVGIDCFTDYYARDVKEAEPRGASRASGLPVRRSTRCRRPTSSALLDGVTHVFHLAAQAGVRKSWGDDFRDLTSHNVDATQRLLEAVKGRPLERVVYASSSSVYGESPYADAGGALPQPVSPYGVTNWPPSTSATCIT